ncbi:MAG: DNA polymerase/3'-5' exonuclease PolX [Candidatus Eisenbacteria bacterium]|nr:DNA polymerase/3'-5' exonuclease PolX [Candidatus Eisenbacteria bacterium]
MRNESVSAAFREIALLLELKGESSFQARAYRRAADGIDRAEDLADLAREGRLTDLPGVGKGLADKIAYFFATGSIPMLADLRREVPPGMVELTGIPGLGAGRARALREEIGVSSPEELEKAVADGRIAQVKGFGPKRIEDLTRALADWRRFRDFRLYHDAAKEAARIGEILRGRGASRTAPAGEVGLYREIAGVIRVVAAMSPEAALHALAIEADTALEGDRVLFRSAAGLPGEARAVAPERFGAVLVWETGADAHRTALVAAARERGFLFDPKGLSRNGTPVETPDEETFFSLLGLPFLPPEIRERADVVEDAAAGRFPRLVVREDLKGALHVHSDWSDGTASIRAMAERAAEMGYAYLALSDHSRSAGYAGGLSAERLLEQAEEVDRVNTLLAPFRVFRGIESDILADGRLDYDDGALARLDFVVASVHSRFGLDREEQTERILRAILHPQTTWLGHSSGRLLLEREAYDFDAERVWRAAGEARKGVELNGHPSRLDVDWRVIPGLRALGVPVPIAVDAHDPEGLAVPEIAIRIARKGGLRPEEVPNTLGVEAFAEWIARR